MDYQEEGKVKLKSLIINIEEDYEKKEKTIFDLMNFYRQNPLKLAQKLKTIQSYLDPKTNILSEPNKIQIQMVEGNKIFDETINYLENISPLEPLQWDKYLYSSAKEHVNDIGPKGLLQYESSDGTLPEKRITKYGNYVDSFGENINFGPEDALGVIIALALDDNEEGRNHRKNLFESKYKKVGIVCGPHQSEYQMCVMDFAYDFIPLEYNELN